MSFHRHSSILRSSPKWGTLLSILLMLPTAISAQPAPEWAEGSLDAWYEAFNAEDAEALSMLYSLDAVRLLPVHPTQEGREAIMKGFASAFEEDDEQCDGAFDGFEVIRDLAFGWGTDECATMRDGEAKTMKSRWMAAFREHEGEWLIVYETWEPVE